MNIGDRVRWSSQAQGTWKTKVGKIVQVVNPNQVPDPIFIDLQNGMGMPRGHESYVVEVERIHKKTGKVLGAKHYWPKVSALTVISKEDA